MTLDQVLESLRRTLAADVERGFQVGDLVNRLKVEYGLTVKEVAARLGASRQRLSEMRRTAKAFPPAHRRHSVDFQFYTLSARAARRLALEPIAVLLEVMHHGLESTRQATAFLAAKVRDQNRLRKGNEPKRPLVFHPLRSDG